MTSGLKSVLVVATIAAGLVLPAAAPGSAETVRSGEDVYAFGDAAFHGSTGGMSLDRPVVGMAAHPNGGGYWEVALDGDVFPFGSAASHGSLEGIALNEPIVGMAPTRSGEGYWLVASDGGIFAFGDAGYFGSAGGFDLNEPIVGMAATPTGEGYWLVASDGGIFAFGDADFFGSAGGIDLNRPIVGMAPTSSGDGYWLVASDGGIFAFGNADFFGSAGAIDLDRPIVAMASTGRADGYWLAARDGGVLAFGDARFFGSAADDPAADKPVVDIAATPDGDGYWLLARAVEVCTNEVWRAEYPQGWHTNSGAVERPCSYFHPDDFRLEPGTEATDIAMHLRRSPVPFDRTREAGGRCETVLSAEETTVDDRPAVVFEVRSTGACLQPEGVRSYRYVVDLGADSLIGSVHEGGEPSYDRSKLALDNTMATLDLG